MIHLLVAILVSTTAVTPEVTSPSQLAFAATRSFGLHGCDPEVAPPVDSAVYCASVLTRNRTHRSFGDRIQDCLDHRVDGPPLDANTELSFVVAHGTVTDLACPQ